MADQKKPRKIKDLKARLGRTIAPNTQGGAAGAAVPPPNVGGAARPAGGGGVVPPPSIGGAPAAGGVAPPPFAQPAAPKKASSDPFRAASVAPPPASEVRIAFDEKPVSEVEVGRRKRGQVFLLIAIGVIGGLVIGGLGGSMRADRKLYNLAVQDGKDIYNTVRTASDTVSSAQRFVDAANTAARGAPGKAPRVDYEAIEGLRSLEKPLQANTFSRKRYRAFKPETVDSLFEYYNNVNLLWEKFATLANRSLPEARRTILDEQAAAAADVASPKGCVPQIQEGRWTCGLVFVSPHEEGDGTTVNVRTRRNTPQMFPKTVLVQVDEETMLPEEFAGTPQNYVLLLNAEQSIGVLGEAASDFAAYTTLLAEIKVLLDRTIEIQGRLEGELGDVARLEEIFVL